MSPDVDTAWRPNGMLEPDDCLLALGGIDWPQAPCQGTVSPHEIHVYRFALDVRPRVLSTLMQWLTPDELARAGRFRKARDAARYGAGRAVVRRILGDCLGQRPERVRLVYGADGKPALAGDARVRFNLSRSNGLGLLAVQFGDDVGVDVEEISPFRAALDVARQLFAREDFYVLSDTPAPERATAFFRCWTRKEAVIKALGCGLSQPLSDFTVGPVNLTAPRTVIISNAARSPSCTLLPVADPRPGFAAALATLGPSRAVRYWTWQPDD